MVKRRLQRRGEVAAATKMDEAARAGVDYDGCGGGLGGADGCSSDCKRLQSFPNLPSSILYLSMDGCTVLQNSLPRSISKQFKLENLSVKICKRLELLPGIASTVLHVSLGGLTS